MIELKKLTTRSELEAVQSLEADVWNMPTIPLHQTMTAVKNGGLIIGAFDRDKLVGFSYGFAGFTEGEPYLCSHMLGIHPDYRSQKIGEQLKLRQRELAIDMGYSRMKWTYDPLETRNGYLNLTKLRGICDTYIVDCYGEMEGDLNQGLPTDRFEVHWHLTSDYVGDLESDLFSRNFTKPILEQFSSQVLPVATLSWTEEFPVLHPNLPDQFNADAYSLPVPKDVQEMKKNHPELALDWRMKTRDLFVDLFSNHYVVVALTQHATHNAYILVPKHTLNLKETLS